MPHSLAKSTYIFVAQEAHDLVVALGREHAEFRRHVQEGGCVWEIRQELAEQTAEWEAHMQLKSFRSGLVGSSAWSSLFLGLRWCDCGGGAPVLGGQLVEGGGNAGAKYGFDMFSSPIHTLLEVS